MPRADRVAIQGPSTRGETRVPPPGSAIRRRLTIRPRNRPASISIRIVQSVPPLRQPPSLAFWAIAAAWLLLLFPAALPAQDEPGLPTNVSLLRDIRYREGENASWRLDLAMPRDSGAEPRPAVVVIHGGGWIRRAWRR